MGKTTKHIAPRKKKNVGKEQENIFQRLWVKEPPRSGKKTFRDKTCHVYCCSTCLYSGVPIGRPPGIISTLVLSLFKTVMAFTRDKTENGRGRSWAGLSWIKRRVLYNVHSRYFPHLTLRVRPNNVKSRIQTKQ